MKIGRASLSENADDLPRDQLKTDKCGGENSGYGYDLFFQGVTNPAVQLCSVVEAKDGLAALSDADGHNVLKIIRLDLQTVFCELHGPESCEIDSGHDTGDGLADDRGRGSTCDAPMESKDKQRVQAGVDDGSCHYDDHRVSGAAVGPNQIAEPIGGDQKRKSQCSDPCVGQGIGKYLFRGTEGDQDRFQEKKGKNT